MLFFKYNLFLINEKWVVSFIIFGTTLFTIYYLNIRLGLSQTKKISSIENSAPLEQIDQYCDSRRLQYRSLKRTRITSLSEERPY